MSEFADFLKKRKDTEQGEQQSAQEAKQKWLSSLNDLYNQMKTWLDEPVREGLITIEEGSVSINEETIGYYTAPAINLRTDRETIVIEPVGRNIIGAQGRVDISSVNGQHTLLYLSSDSQWYLDTKQRPHRLQPLTGGLFNQLLKDLIA